ncbi:Retrovirus-related Pol polyprotein from transposon 17.6 [Melia azedarach]|uniref:Retrovirus-related Pol polyprotein from transposon 17.6 n=1 Tax=Melia azedarach TaxID=155640 RepID=A0ACC1XNS3_MELAZ|nr:Retrovirus-related Pol polyprotein from transposon 17.6 [Melia azedarach]
METTLTPIEASSYILLLILAIPSYQNRAIISPPQGIDLSVGVGSPKDLRRPLLTVFSAASILTKFGSEVSKESELKKVSSDLARDQRGVIGQLGSLRVASSVGNQNERSRYNLRTRQRSQMPNSEAPRRPRREVTREPGQSSRPPPAPPQDKYAESQNVRALDQGPSRKGKEKAATSRDVEAKKAKEVRELAETRSQFQHVIKYLCDNLGIPPPPPRNLASRLGSQLRSNPAHVEPSTPSQQGAQMRLSQLRANVHDQPRSHRSDHRSTASNRPEGARSQLEGLVHGDLRYSLMARRQGEGNDPEPPYVECLRKQLLTMQEKMRELRSSKGEPSSPDILGDFTAPLADSVKNATLPGRFKMPQLDSYHGQSDPVAHVKIFQNLMLVQGVPDEIMCKVFLTTLSEPARTWYKKLPAGSQRGQELLHEYVKRYHDEVMQMGVYEEPKTLRNFWYNLHTGPLWVSFEERPPTSYREAHDRAMKQIAIEEKRNLKREREKAEDFSDKGKDMKKQDVRPSRLVPPQGKAQVVRQAGESSGGDQGQPGSHVTKDKDFISTISGGPTLAGDSRRVRKTHAKEPSLARHHQEVNFTERSPKLPRVATTPIMFTDEDTRDVVYPHDDTMVVTMKIASKDVARILIDTGSSVDILFKEAFNKLGLNSARMQQVTTPLSGFMGDQLMPSGSITLPVTLGEDPSQLITMVDFVVVDHPSSYNVILGRPFLMATRGVVSTYHLKLKFPVGNQVGVVKGDQLTARRCYASSVGRCNQVSTLDPRVSEVEQRGEPVEELEAIPVCEDDPTKVVKVGTQLTSDVRTSLVEFLVEYSDAFAWSHSDMPGISLSIISHRLNVDSIHRPVRQKRRAFNQERYDAIEEEVDKLLRAWFIRESKYPDWVSNVVLVRKPNGKWRMCVDFTDLNKACPKDSFPLPRIDQLVDATAGHELLSFMDAFSGYNQVKMYAPDEEGTSFITNKGLYCYMVMPFGLKNAGATYQRLVNKLFKEQIGRTMKIYVDDMITKSMKIADHVPHLRGTFDVLRKFGMKLNPEKCAIGVAAGKFLGYMVHQRGIEANPEKIKAIVEMRSPRTTKEIQSLAGRVAALSRFVSKCTDRCHPFFQAIKRAKGQQWDKDCEAVFQNLKNYLASPPILARPHPGDNLLMYLAVSTTAVSSVLIREEEGGMQKPVYYTSKALTEVEKRYPKQEQLALALVMSSRKLRPYFQAHTVSVVTSFPLRQIVHKPESSGRLMKWCMELSEFKIHYRSRNAIKGQAIANFVAEFTPDLEDLGTDMNQREEWEAETSSPWILHVDGSSSSQGSRAGVLITSPDGVEISYALRFEFKASNNEAEYEALIAGLKMAKSLGAEWLASLSETSLPGTVLVEVLPRSFIEEPTEVVHCVSSPSCWINPIKEYLEKGRLPEDQEAARKLKYCAARYCIIEGVLYRRSFTMPYLRCLHPDEADYVLREIHKGACGNHSGGRSLAYKALRQGYYWPTMQSDSRVISQTCLTCQKHAKMIRVPPENLTTLTSPWPFAQWGIDLIGPFPVGRGQAKFAIVAVDYFTKWAEVEPLAKITEKRTTDFIWRSIICRFGVPRVIITDNGRQFDNEKFRNFCETWMIENRYTTPAHPQSNGQVEAVNKAYRTTFKTATRETPYALSFGTEAVIPAEVGMPTFRVLHFDEVSNMAQLDAALDLLDEKRDQAQVRVAAYQRRVSKYYNAKVKPRSFKEGDLVLRKVIYGLKEGGSTKFAETWEGLFHVTKVIKPGVYKLAHPDGRQMRRPRNADQLKKYYP